MDDAAAIGQADPVMPRALALLLMLTVFASCPAAETPLPRLFVVGDSISIQYGPFLETFLSGVYRYDRKQDDAGAPKAAHNLDVPTGANGGDSAMVLAYLRQRRLNRPLPPGVLLLNCGLHDVKTDAATGLRQVPLARYADNLRAILDEARLQGQRLVWVRTTPVIDEIHNARSRAFHRHASDVAAYNEAADAIMRAAGVPVVDLHGFSAHLVPAGFVDHVHYDAACQEKQAAFIAGALGMLDAR
jgi:lysophospholipase L1-like esterase